HQINSFLESNHSNNDDQISSPIPLALNHSKDHIEIFCDDNLHESDSETIKLDHENANNSTTVSQGTTGNLCYVTEKIVLNCF
ncbi:10866_t:CDS:1, partial [Racocetra fulgida]